MKIHENFHVKSKFHHDKSNRMEVYAYLVPTYEQTIFVTYLSLSWFSFKITTGQDFFFMDIEKPFTFFMVKRGIKSNNNNLLLFNYWPFS